MGADAGAAVKAISASRVDVGLVREDHRDVAVVHPELGLAVVAGAVELTAASSSAAGAVSALGEHFARAGGIGGSGAGLLSRLAGSVEAARRHALSSAAPSLSLVAAATASDSIAVVRTGSARCFSLRDGRIEALVASPDEAEASVLRTARPGDAYVLCTQGLWGTVGLETMGAILSVCTDPAEACDRLVGAAWAAGGLDEIAVAVVRLLLA